ncbi:MAG: hypothetical protein HY079_05905 [Elusimicrobia bacterium]|nr:hypothetical protein [Elusimicrobiota bacterium]
MLIESQSRISRPRWFLILRRAILVYFFSLPPVAVGFLYIAGKWTPVAHFVLTIDEGVKLSYWAILAIPVPGMILMGLELYFVLFWKVISKPTDASVTH